MKKLLIILGAIFATIILILVIIAAIFIPRTLKLDRSATAYIQTNIPPIVANWNTQQLIDRATPELIAIGQKHDDLDRLFEMFRQLGAFKTLDQPRGVVTTTSFTGTGTQTIGNYTAHADFEKGPAVIQIQLRRTNETWQINGFRINSDVFLPTKP